MTLSNVCAYIYVKYNKWEPKSVLIMIKNTSLLYDMKMAMNGMKVRPFCRRCHTISSFNENNI